jgi:hypothetical protein
MGLNTKTTNVTSASGNEFADLGGNLCPPWS